MDIDYGDIVVKTAITYSAARFLDKYLVLSVRLPKWEKVIRQAWIGGFLLLFFVHLTSLKFVSDLYYTLLAIGIFLLLYELKDVRLTRMIMIAILPFIVTSLVSKILSWLPLKIDLDFFESAVTISAFWMGGFMIYSYQQGKQERIQRLKDEEEKRTMEAKKNELEYQVTERTSELLQQKEELEKTLTELKATQAQLVQSEKLASLGELTAGIAHEIQNPLNFVNNFSELSVELAQELKEEMEKIVIPEEDKEYIFGILGDLSQNQTKISYHGKRASRIVKGMLEHSRTSTGEVQLTDINALTDEYLRLSYHGLRAKDKSFNAKIGTNFEENLPKIKVIPQDLGRVLLNLFNNAFYALNKRRAEDKGQEVKGSGIEVEGRVANKMYEPKVSVATKMANNQLIIVVSDNGTGISDESKAKIFQPFFTTKPTGEGTGLGLSLAYDIITKGHKGTIEVESTEGVGTEFIVKLPI